eukprot:185531-Prorocentrum_minimum.AAC.3
MRPCSSSSGSSSVDPVPVRTPPHSELPVFDEVEDRTCLDPKASKQRDDSLFAKLWAGAYTRLEPDRLVAEHGLRRLFSWLEGGLRLKTTKELSFPMLYDLLTSQVTTPSRGRVRLGTPGETQTAPRILNEPERPRVGVENAATHYGQPFQSLLKGDGREERLASPLQPAPSPLTAPPVPRGDDPRVMPRG